MCLLSLQLQYKCFIYAGNSPKHVNQDTYFPNKQGCIPTATPR